jgi:hypothetical protein
MGKYERILKTANDCENVMDFYNYDEVYSGIKGNSKKIILRLNSTKDENENVSIYLKIMIISEDVNVV